VSSDIILGHGWAARGFSANTIPTDNQGAGFLIAEGGTPNLVKAAYLTDTGIKKVAAYGQHIRTTAGLITTRAA